MLGCYDVANYFLDISNTKEGEVITNLKLQKLVYYAQSASLALYDTPLFQEAIEAWKYGPVVPELYHAYKQYGSASLPQINVTSANTCMPREIKLMDDVYVFFGQFAAWKLRDMTHEETPWKEAFAVKGAISLASMQSYFRVYWADQMYLTVTEPDAFFRDLHDVRWEPSEAAMEAANRYKKGRVVGDMYISEAV